MQTIAITFYVKTLSADLTDCHWESGPKWFSKLPARLFFYTGDFPNEQ
jgi:hypothetical protein